MAVYSGSGFDYGNAGRVSNSVRKAWSAYTGPALGITQGFIKAGMGALNFFSGGGYGGGAMASGAIKGASSAIGSIAPNVTSMFEKSANKRFGYNRNTASRTSKAAAVGVTSAGIGNTIASAVLGNYSNAVSEAAQLGVGLAAGLKAQNNGGNFEDAYVRGAYSPIQGIAGLADNTKFKTTKTEKTAELPTGIGDATPTINTPFDNSGLRGSLAGSSDEPMNTGIGNAVNNTLTGGFGGGFKNGGPVRKPIYGTQAQYQAYQDSLTNYLQGESLYKDYTSDIKNEEGYWEENTPTRVRGVGNQVAENYTMFGIGETGYPGGVTRFKKPVQPIIYQPEDIRMVRATSTTPYRMVRGADGIDRIEYLPQRPKEQPITLQSSKPDLLQSNSNMELNPIPFTKGTYFTRERQRQEESAGKKKDYFDKKTGKLLGTYKDGGLYKKSYGQTPEIGSPTSDSIRTNNVEDGSVVIPAYMKEVFLSKYGKYFPELQQTMDV